MKTWEYLFVICDYRKHLAMPRYINDEEIDEWKKKSSISEFANQKGREGWELISADNTAQEYIFKREIISTATLNTAPVKDIATA